MFRYILWLGVMPVVLALAGCHPIHPLILTEEDNGRTVELFVGERLWVELVANPSTGYEWTIESLDTGVLAQQGEGVFTPNQSLPGETGQGGIFTLKFIAMHPGETVLQLIYSRPFDTETPPAQVFEVTIVVVP